MKGKLCIGSLILFITCLLSLSLFSDVNALSLTDYGVDFGYKPALSGSFTWSGVKNIPGQYQPVGPESYVNPIHLGQHVKFFYQPITIDGNHASIHFETNVVWHKLTNFNSEYIGWFNLSRQELTFCYVGNTRVNIENQSLSYAQTSWDNGTSNTLTIYGDVTLSGLTSGATNQQIFCNWGSDNTSFPFFDSEFPNDTILYVEQNPSSIIFSNNLNDALLSQQIAQQEVQIQLQTQMNDKLDDLSSQSQQNAQDIMDNQNQNTQDIIKSNQRCHSSRNLIQTINWQTNNVTKTEDGDIVKLTANSGTLARAVFGLPFLEQGKTYTLSFYSKGVSTAGSLTYARIREYSNSGNWLTPQSTIPVSSDFVRVSVTFTASDISSPFAWLYLSSSTSSTNDIEIYVKDFQLEEGSSATEYIPFGEEVCQNYNEEISDFLHDNTPPSVDTSSMSNSAGWLPPGPVDSILTLPVVFIQSILSAFNNDACRDVVLPLPYLENKTLTLPCMRPLLNQMGFLTIYEVVGSVISMFVIYNTLKWLYKFVDDTLTFREDNSFGGGI